MSKKQNENQKEKEGKLYFPEARLLLYKMIGQRVRQYRKLADPSKYEKGEDQSPAGDRKPRKKSFVSQGDFCDYLKIDYVVLSKIERGKAEKSNPYLLSEAFIELISREFEMTPIELIWGKKEDKVTLIKIFCIAVLINGSNVIPFLNEDFSTWLATQKQTASEELITSLNCAKKTCEFFINPQNYELYKSLQMRYLKDYEEISAILLKHLLLDLDYYGCFFEYLQNRSKYDLKEFQTIAKSFLIDEGNYPDFFQIEAYYPYFIVAFHNYWERVQAEYMNFFEKEIFALITEEEGGTEKDNAKHAHHGLMKVSNELFYNKITSLDFRKLNKWLLIRAEHTDGKAAVASVRQRMSIWAMINKDSKEVFPSDEDIGL